ncbi:hypothetical protein AB0N93_33720 [Streptomyces sp. NPDC091267]|uniref:hypothetical protein n=1 Tax=Streptomyces sp. NPDC091267 TaxID=3155195 RepID=UPI003435653C
MNTTARTLRSSITVAGAGLLLATAGAAVAPGATAVPADSEPPALRVATAAPAEIGLAGQPVGFTTTASNIGTHDTSAARLIYRVDGGAGLPSNAVSLQYRLSGTEWKAVPLTLTGTEFSGELPERFPLAASQSRTVQLRLGLPMGTPHNGDSNGGTDRLKLTTMVSYGASGAANDTDEDTVKVDGLASGLSGVPATATAGGPGVTFRATVSNPTASAYENVTDVLFTNRYATVQKLRSGTWTTLAPITDSAEPDVYGFDIIGKDAAMTPHSSTSVKVRVTYRKDAPVGKTTVHPCAFVNEGSLPFRGTTSCGASASIKVTAAGTGTATPTASASATTPATATPSTSTTPAPATATTSGTTTQLARTGSSNVSAAAVAAAALVAAGAGALGFPALRRRRSRR